MPEEVSRGRGYDTRFADLRPDSSGAGLSEYVEFPETSGYQSSELRTVRESPPGILFKTHYTSSYGGAEPGTMAYTTYCWGAPKVHAVGAVRLHWLIR